MFIIKNILKSLSSLQLMCLTGLAGYLAVLPVSAQDVLVQDARILDVSDGSLTSGDVLVIDGRFAGIGIEIEDIPQGIRVIDAQGLSLLPGLIDVHTHWTNMNGANRSSIASDLLKAGVTTATDFHSSPESFASKRAYHASILSPHVFYTARVGVPYGHGTSWGDENMTKIVFSVRDGEEAVRSLLPYRPDAIKVFSDGWRYGASTNLSSVSEDVLATIVQDASAEGLPVISHTVTVEGGKLAARAGVRAIVHAIQNETADDELITLLKDNEVLYSPTLTVYEPFEVELREMSDFAVSTVMDRQVHSKENFKKFAAAGVKFALGTDQGIDNNPFGEADLRELELLVEFGLEPIEALRAATLNSASVLKLEDDRGSIEIGKRADFILVDGTPWQDISEMRKVRHVFVDGAQLVKDGELTKDQKSSVVTATMAQRLVSDFERNELSTNSGAQIVKTYDIGLPRSQVLLGLVQRSQGGSQALHVSAEMVLKDDPYAYVTIPLSSNSFTPVDASIFSGVRFEARGARPQEIVVVSSAGEVSCHFQATPDWEYFQISFDDFCGRDDVEINADRLFSVSFGARADAGQMNWLEIDNVEFY